MKVLSIVGARPQFVKIAPLCRAFREAGGIAHVIVHTGQHYDFRMSKVFFDELGIPEPDYNLEVGSGTHAVQTGEMLKKAEEVLLRESPGMVVVYGDTNSTLAGALAAAKIGIPTAHVEAGLRSYRKAMPEEVNRVVADHLAALLLVPTVSAAENLRREGFREVFDEGRLWDDWEQAARRLTVPPAADAPLIVNVGDIMLDALSMCLDRVAREPAVLATLGAAPGEYDLVTIHRAENTDDPARLRTIVDALSEAGRPSIFPAHPRCVKAMRAHGIAPGKSVRLTEPVGYLDMLLLERNARVVVTDSGGVQKEAFFLGVPCVTLRDETEWAETLADGRNRLAGGRKEDILEALREADRLGRFSPGDAFGRRDAARRIALLIARIAELGRPDPGGRTGNRDGSGEPVR